MADFELIITPRVYKEADGIPKAQYKKIDQAILKLPMNPFPPNCKKLAGSRNGYRLRVGDYRVLYSIEKNLITVYHVSHRKDVYR